MHAAADGGLARIRVPGGALTARQLRVVAAAARELGSGVIELTSRANLQVRGLPPQHGEPLPAVHPSRDDAHAPDGESSPVGVSVRGDVGVPDGESSPVGVSVRGDVDGDTRVPDGGRRLSPAPDFAARLAAAGLLPSATHERVRNIVASPLAGRAPASMLDVRPLVSELDGELCARPALADLPGRFLFALDDGSGDMVALGADVTLLPVDPADASVDVSEVALLLAGADHGLRTPVSSAVTGMLAVAEAFLAERAEQGAGAWRLAELTDGPGRVSARALRAEPDLRQAAAPAVRRGRTVHGGTVGVIAQRDGRSALTVLAALGRLTAAQLEVLAQAAEHGGGEVRVTPWRTIVVPDLPSPEVDGRRATLTAAGLVGDPASPWLGLTACAGRPGCAKALADVHADVHAGVHADVHTYIHADIHAGVHPNAGDTGSEAGADGPDDVHPSRGLTRALPVHWSGCERRCGRPRGRVVDVVATGDGYRVEADDVSRTFADAEQTSAAVAATREGT
ncbi:precorrin-3B synthase [Streptosporangium sp. NBC_01755]|uniref:precorrin-3B synthase n=1 Tax=unclassified Streptosporangium TaxID=2632669 RepID=UPI002DDC3CC7|nr:MULTISPECIES: precorrin-3B synthase [unclassified Streptosporangium]WSA29462.1 precorrin-3B synthase [Streptosporangium sp. NBC_01810]WSC99118.1 precorrin-3B synthase [Streptosporangium sp. NBC_01755]